MHVQVATEQVTKTIEGYILAATLGEGGITRAMQVCPFFSFPALLSFPIWPCQALSCVVVSWERSSQARLVLAPMGTATCSTSFPSWAAAHEPMTLLVGVIVVVWHHACVVWHHACVVWHHACAVNTVLYIQPSQMKKNRRLYLSPEQYAWHICL